MTIIEQVNSIQDAEARIEFIKNHYHSHENGSYHKSYSAEELQEKKDKFSTECMDLSDMESEFKDLVTEWKAKIKLQKAQKDMVMQAIRNRGEWLNGVTYLLADHDTGIMVTYDGEGNLLSSRKMKPGERQLRIKAM